MISDRKEWLDENPVVADWLDSVTVQTQSVYLPRFIRFYCWITASRDFENFSPSDLLDFQEQSSGRKRIVIANRLARFLKELSRSVRPKTVIHYYSVVHSFFRYHGCDLPRRGFTLSEDHLEPTSQKLDRKSLIQVLQVAKQRDRAIYTICFQAGLGFREFDIFNRSYHSQIKSQLDDGAEYLMINLPARKKNRGRNRGFFSVIGKDGTKLLREWIETTGEPIIGGALFVSKQPNGRRKEGTAIQDRSFRKVFENLCRRANLVMEEETDLPSTAQPRTGYTPHQCRDVLRTQWQRSGADPMVCEFMLGHVVDSNFYLKFSQMPDYVLAQYKIAEERISLLSRPDMDVIPASEINVLKNRLDEQARYIEILKDLAREMPELVYNSDYMFDSRPIWLQAIRRTKKTITAMQEERS